jgi:hypothetical protein
MQPCRPTSCAGLTATGGAERPAIGRSRIRNAGQVLAAAARSLSASMTNAGTPSQKPSATRPMPYAADDAEVQRCGRECRRERVHSVAHGLIPGDRRSVNVALTAAWRQLQDLFFRLGLESPEGLAYHAARDP